MRKSNTHFEQVPLAALKKLLQTTAEVNTNKPNTRAENLTVERPVYKTESYSVRKSS